MADRQSLPVRRRHRLNRHSRSARRMSEQTRQMVLGIQRQRQQDPIAWRRRLERAARTQARVEANRRIGRELKMELAERVAKGPQFPGKKR